MQHWFGISSTALNLLSSFLSDRFQTVITPASKSNSFYWNMASRKVARWDPCSILNIQFHFIQLYRNILAFVAIFMQMTLKYTCRFLLNWLLLLSRLLKLGLRIFFREWLETNCQLILIKLNISCLIKKISMFLLALILI